MFTLILTVVALADAPLEVTLEDPNVTAVVLDCGPSNTLKANVVDGKASFSAVPSQDCQVLLVRKGGVINSGGAWTCELDSCSQEDVHHLPVTDGSGRLNVIVPNLPPGASIEIQCPAGYRDRQTVIENTAVFEGVPADRCTMLVKGAVPARFSPISEGTWYCRLAGTTAVCHQKVR